MRVFTLYAIHMFGNQVIVSGSMLTLAISEPTASAVLLLVFRAVRVECSVQPCV